ncbi:MAG: iron-containing alcohol dehydrogenase [Acutalibacteraceae bacterium]
MYNFMFYVPTRIYFGKGQISHLSELKNYGSKVLLVYGGGSIKRNGIYDNAVRILKDAGVSVYELSGVEPNPKIETVRKGVSMCKAEGIDMVLAIGGGSTIDCAKVVAAGAKYDGDAWDLVLDGSKIKAALPIFSVLTLSATGSEMDEFAVISDMTKNEKWGTAAEVLKPTMSVLDPTYTFSVSKKQTAAGTADMMSHTFENYFTKEKGADVQARFAEGLLKTMIKYGPIALAHPDDYDARANLMWAASHAINGLVAAGSQPAWCVHPMEHELSAFYDITHGQGLAILTPVWMEFVLKKDPSTAENFAVYGRNVWEIADDDDESAAKKAIEATRTFLFETMELPANLRAVGIDSDEHFEIMAEKAAEGCVGCFVPLTKDDIVEIFRSAF